MNNSCVIIAQGKTGSTGMFHSLLQTERWGKNYYEPKGKVSNPDRKNCLTKLVLEDFEVTDDKKMMKMLVTLSRYRHKIVLVRDPRDRFVSGLCFRGYRHLKCHATKAKYYDLLKQKSKDPSSISCVELSNELRRLSSDNFDLIKDAKEGGFRLAWLYHNLEKKIFYRYEDFVKGDFEEVEDYIGLKGLAHAPVDKYGTRKKAIRKKATGDFRHWFTPEDVEFFRDEDNFMLDYMSYFGYNNIEDWELAPEQIIEPEFSYKYFKKLVGL